MLKALFARAGAFKLLRHAMSNRVSSIKAVGMGKQSRNISLAGRKAVAIDNSPQDKLSESNKEVLKQVLKALEPGSKWLDPTESAHDCNSFTKGLRIAFLKARMASMDSLLDSAANERLIARIQAQAGGIKEHMAFKYGCIMGYAVGSVSGGLVLYLVGKIFF